jgi:hypothetical protein
MKLSMALKFIFSGVLLVTVAALLACKSPDTGVSTSAAPTTPPDRVEVDYFYEADCCFCLGLASQWINDAISGDYQNQIDSGLLVYNSYNTQDEANDRIKQQFNAPNFSLFITTVYGSERNTREVRNLWLYTDSSGENEMLHSKFLGVLKGELDRALAGN